MHTNQRTANIDTGFGGDSFYCNRIGESIPCSHRKAAACMRLRHYIDNLISAFFSNFSFQNESPVQMLTALNCQMNTLLLQNRIDACKGCLCCLHGGTLANSLADHFAGRTADHKKGTGFQLCLLQQLSYHCTCLFCNIFVHIEATFLR